MSVNESEFYAYKDVARLFKCCVRTVARAFRNRPKWRQGNLVRISGHDLARFIKEGWTPRRRPKPDKG